MEDHKIHKGSVLHAEQLFPYYTTASLTQRNTNFNKISKYYRNRLSAELINIHIGVYWVMTPCNLVGRHQRFRETYSLYAQGKSEPTWGEEMGHREQQWPIRIRDGPQVGQREIGPEKGNFSRGGGIL
jgi:hypothetical protein